MSVEGPSGPVEGRAREHRQLAVLALLGAAGESGCSRDALVGRLSPDVTDRAARHGLSDALYLLRQALGKDAILAEGERVRLNPSSIQVDLTTFEDAVARDDLESAVELYGGPFLDGFFLKGTHEFEHWVDVERQRIGTRYAQSLASLARRSERALDHRAACSWWRRLALHDPYDTGVAIRLMEALCRAGDPGNALLHGREHRALLRDALEIDAPRELVEAIARIKSGAMGGMAGPGPADGPIADPDTVPSSREPSVFVARSAELARLDDAFAAAVAGRGRVMFIAGEAGTGKTALATEFGRRALGSRADLLAVSCRCHAHTGAGDPYHPFRQLLALLTGDPAGSATAEARERLTDAVADSVPALIEHAPGLLDTLIASSTLARRLSALAPPGASWRSALDALRERRAAEPQLPVEQSAVLDQYTRWVLALARSRPLVLVVDDLQWADSGTLGLFFELGRRLESARILLIGLYRSEDVSLGRDGARHPLEPVLNELKRAFGECELRLGETPDPGFVDALIDVEPNRLDRTFRQALCHFTHGHALFTVELLRGMRDQGMLIRDDEDRWIASPSLSWEALPARVDAVLAERIGRVSERARQLLALAAVEGEDFTVETLAAAAGKDVDAVIASLSEEIEKRHRLVTATGGRIVGGRRCLEYRFRHILIQQYVYAHLDPVERARLHERIGTALEALCAEAGADEAPRLARHFREAGRPSRAIDYHRMAAQRARETGALREAMAHFREALDLVAELPESAERDRIELDLLAMRGTIFFGTTGLGLEEARRALERAEELARKLRDRRQWLMALTGLFQLNHLTARHRAGGELLKEVRQHAREAADTGSLALIEWSHGLNGFNRGRFGRAVESAREALALGGTAAGDPILLDFVYHLESAGRGLEALALALLGFPERARMLSREAEQLSMEAQQPVSHMVMTSYRLFVHVWLRDVQRACEWCRSLRALAEEIGTGEMAIIALIYDGWCESERGDPSTGAQRMRAGLESYRAQGWAVWRWHFESLVAESLGRCGEVEEGLQLLDRGLASLETTDERFYEAELHRLRGQLLEASGALDESEHAFRRAIDVARKQDAKWWELRAAVGLGRLLLARDRRAEGREHLAATYGWFTEGFDTPDLREARTLLDLLA